jgi:glycosyltransferase involved in cell wall biosynthesis
MRRLIIAWNYLEWGGAQIYFLAIIKRAIPSWEVTVLLPQGSSRELIGFLEGAGAKCRFLRHGINNVAAGRVSEKIRRQLRRVRSEWELYFELSKLARSGGVVHLETAPWQSWLLLTALSLNGTRVFSTLHNAMAKPSPLRRLVWKARLALVSRLPNFHVFASNVDTKRSLKEWVAPAFWNSIRVTFTAIDPAEIDDVLTNGPDGTELRKRFGIAADDFVVLCVGQFVDRKGRWVFLEAAKEVCSAEMNVKFIWLSPNAGTDEELERVRAFGLGERFMLLRSADVGSGRIGVLQCYKICDVFALPSFVEGLPIALLEAMALRIPCISTDVYAIPEALINEKTGLTIGPGRAAELAEAIRRLMLSESEREKLGNAGSAFVLDHFDERKQADIALAAYLESMGTAPTHIYANDPATK